MACEASTVRGEGTELCDETQKGAQFLDVFRSLEVSQRRELFIVGADAAIRDDVSCELYGTAQFELFLDMVMLLSAHLCKTVVTRSSSSDSFSAQMIVSSTIFIA